MEYIELCEKYEALPCRDKIIEIIKEIRNLIFPGYFNCLISELEENDKKLINKIKDLLKRQIICAYSLAKIDGDEVKIVNEFMDSIPNIIDVLKTDLQATFDGDPAALDINEIILAYPGMFAISVHRIANKLYQLGVPYIPRIMSEYAHSKTGIDIHPGATIGKYFFIDHGTGIVIGETAVIGEHVKIYQGVTLGALSLGRGQKLKGSKRHPTIGDYVTIYSGASILGGETIIGNNVTIGSNTYVLESIPENTIVRLNKVDMEMKKK